MECPHCHQALPFLLCLKCGKETPEGGRYCSHCGILIERVTEKGKSAEEDDFSKRRLCSDGTCIGVINEQGACNICGKPYAGEPS
jgi:hypothetical protein